RFRSYEKPPGVGTFTPTESTTSKLLFAAPGQRAERNPFFVFRYSSFGFSRCAFRFSLSCDLCDAAPAYFVEEGHGAEEVQGPYGAGDFGACYFFRGGRRARLWRICRWAPRIVSGHRANVRGDARRGGQPPRPADCHVSRTLWRPHPADPPRK